METKMAMALLLILGIASAANLTTTINKSDYKDLASQKIADYSNVVYDKAMAVVSIDTVTNKINKPTNTLTDCDLFTCNLKVKIEPAKELTLEKDFIKGLTSDSRITFDTPFFYDIRQVEKERTIYKDTIEEQCRSQADNKSEGKNITLCYNVTVQKAIGTEKYLVDETFENTELSTIGKTTEIILRAHKPNMNINTDLGFSIFGQERWDAAWWNASYVKIQGNSTTNGTCSAAYCQFSMYVAVNSTLTNGTEIRVTDCNATAESELGFWREDGWNYTNASGTLWVNITNNTGCLNVYQPLNKTGVADKSNIDATFLMGDDFSGSSVNGTKEKIYFGSASTSVGGGHMNTTGLVFYGFNSTTYSIPTGTAIAKIDAIASGGRQCRLQTLATSIANENNGINTLTYAPYTGPNTGRETYNAATGEANNSAYSLPEIMKITFTGMNITNPRMIKSTGAAASFTEYTAAGTFTSVGVGSIAGGTTLCSWDFFIITTVATATPTFTFGAQEGAPSAGNLTVNATTGGSASGSNTTFTPPANLTINATASANYYFVNWTTNCNGTFANASNATTTIQVNNATACYAQANFQPTPNTTSSLLTFEGKYKTINGDITLNVSSTCDETGQFFSQDFENAVVNGHWQFQVQVENITNDSCYSFSINGDRQKWVDGNISYYWKSVGALAGAGSAPVSNSSEFIYSDWFDQYLNTTSEVKFLSIYLQDPLELVLGEMSYSAYIAPYAMLYQSGEATSGDFGPQVGGNDSCSFSSTGVGCMHEGNQYLALSYGSISFGLRYCNETNMRLITNNNGEFVCENMTSLVVDGNISGLLDYSNLTNVPTILNGTDGRNGTNGAPGTNGTNASVTSGDAYISVTEGVVALNLTSADARYDTIKPFNSTTIDTTVTDSASYVTLLTLPVRAGTLETIECYLAAKSNLTTSGIQIQLNLSDATGMTQTSVVEYMTTVTAKAICVSDSATIANTCAATTSVVTIVPTYIHWYSTQTNAGLFQLKFKPETNANKAIIAKGAWCRRVSQ